MTSTYGILSDFHAVPVEIASLAIDVLKKEGANALVLNGDIFGERSGRHSQEYMEAILECVGRSGMITFVLPGSHEETDIFEPVLDYFSQRYANIINTFEQPLVEKGDHDLVFLQGSDWGPVGAEEKGYLLFPEQQSGFYQTNEGVCRITNMYDLRTLVKNPEKTILFSHVPRKFDSQNSVDVAEFWLTKQSFQVNDDIYKQGGIVPASAGFKLAEAGAPVELRRENRGNENLRKLYEELGITKNVTGHFHESVHNAHDASSNAVEEGLFVSELFYNAACLDRLVIGMVSVDGPKVAYESINLRKYMNFAN